MNFFATLTFVLMLCAGTGIKGEISINDEFHSKCKFPNCTILLHEEVYILRNRIVLETWDNFELSASKPTIVTCRFSAEEEWTIVDSNQTKNIIIRNVSFVNCSKPKVGNDSFTSMISIEGASVLYMDACSFPDFFQVGLKLYNTESVMLNNIQFKANKVATYNRAVIYENDYTGNALFNGNSLTFDGGNVTNPMYLGHFSSYKHMHKIMGGSLAIIMSNRGRVKVTIINSNFSNSRAMVGGAAYFELWNPVTDFDIEITGCHFENNTAEDPNESSELKISSGGAILIRVLLSHNGQVSIKNSRFSHNKANNGGAIGILLYDHLDKESVLHILDTIFQSNFAKDAGGAIYAGNMYIENRNLLKISDSSFLQNQAQSGGAMLTLNYRVDLMDNVSMRGNMGYYGGAVCLLGSILTFYGSNIAIENNMANHSGGALYLHSSSMVIAKGRETLIANNTAMIRGGGIFVYTKYYENRIHGSSSIWRDRGRLHSIYCFLQSRNHTINNTLTLSNNNVTSVSQLCMGDDLFTNTWGSCYNRSKPFPISSSIVFKDKSVNRCSVALDIVRYSNQTNLTSPCQLILSRFNFTIECNGTLELKNLPKYHHELKQAIAEQGLELEGAKKVHLFFPGYKSQINIQSLDGRNNPIQTLTRIIFKPNNSSLWKRNEVLGISLCGLNNFTIKKLSSGFIFGKICLESHSTLNRVSHCEDAIMGDCPSPLLSAENGQICRIKKSVHNDDGFTFTKKMDSKENRFEIELNPGTRFSYQPDGSTVFMRCTWFQCRCHQAANWSECIVNINAPGEQCQKGLKYPSCTTCKETNKRIIPAFSWYGWEEKGESCYTCDQPFLMIVVYIIMTIGITFAICWIGVDIFSGGLRSIVFYSSTLYVLCINCGILEEPNIYRTLSIPIVISNLLVSHTFPFCLPTKNTIYYAIFDMLAPFLFVAYILIMIIFLEYVPYARNLGKYNAVNKIWTIIILTYVFLCNQAFSILNCPQNSINERIWLFDGSVKCFVGVHLIATIIAIIILFILVFLPILMLIFSRSKPQYKAFLKNYEERYRSGYKQWELFKLILRIIFPFLVTLLPQVVTALELPCSLVSIGCLAVFLFNSVVLPATNYWANQFESLCFFILAYVSFQKESLPTGKVGVNLLLLIPYLIYLIYIIVPNLYNIFSWLIGKYKTLKQARKRN